MFMRSSLVLACAATAAQAFSPSPMGLRPTASSLPASISLRGAGRAMVGLRMQEGDPNAKPEVMFDSNSGWKPAHQMDGAASTGNVDTGDYFESGQATTDDTGFTSGAAATGGTGGDKLGQMLSAANTEVREVERQTYGAVEFNHPKQAWKIDGSYETGDPTFDIVYSKADACAKTDISIEPSAMTFEDFLAGFTADSDPGFKVEPSSGTMARRGGENTDLRVTYSGTALDSTPKTATFVVMLPNDNFQWTFKLRVSFPN
uniref:Plastid lipid-associated protein/fibrillin conserved domain-containing protein n=1 Tax=Hemiselmis tepida TaxID=464990 RepID=A0A7S0YMX3_9CRYP